MRQQPPQRRGRIPLAVLVVVAAVGLIWVGQPWLRSHFGGRATSRVTFRPLGFGPGVTLGSTPKPYPTDDAWRAWLAPESACPGGDDAAAEAAVQATAALCLLNYARGREGLPPLQTSPLLTEAAAQKAADIARCDQFAHEACGKSPDANARALGLTDGRFGENIFWGSPDAYRSPRVAVDRWLNSPYHRENLFREEWVRQGVAVLVVSRFHGANAAAIWVNEFSAP
jgi:uncharacterized protein YkwD